MWYKNFPTGNELIKSLYAQTSEEQIMSHIFDNIKLDNKTFVDIGAGDGEYLSNTALLRILGWKGLGIDADTHDNDLLLQRFITKDNIVSTLKANKVNTNFDLLSIDIDGNDYFILQEIMKSYSPNIIIVELNPIFPTGVAKSIAYNEKHSWNNDNYYGASFSAFRKLLEPKYTLLYNLHELNLFFVKSDKIGGYVDLNIQHEPTFYHMSSPFAIFDETKWIDV